MKKVVFSLALSLVALAFLMAPAMAASSPPQVARVLSVTDQAFLASLATPAATPAAKRPQIGSKSLCTASANCWDGSTVSCSGNSSTTSCSATDSNCSVHQRGSVTCDGVTTSCPICPCDLDCAAERADCIAGCDPCPALFSCNLSTCTITCHCKFSGCFF